ncbi:hypothetical protein CK203_029500 [Vitis vinifera]|uniref:Inhibitor I9 domain-containing protein n=1 Tax=Vitis vinifera TaxID=29760 RepID=A0A438JCA1_VITVI|nr:hypothetical protein CK203_077923 [Vitis vinifera]RVX06566.1 hypothetical protein CK203_029500 [Vitis vinifera]
MASILQFFLSLCLLHLLISLSAASNENEIPKSYVVYMGKSSNNHGGEAEVAESSHLQLLSAIIPSSESERISLIHSYNHAFKGFSAMLTQGEASILSGN